VYLRIGAYLVLILLIIAPALGFGISPARKAHDYQPTISGEITIVNNQRESLDLYLVPRGELAEYVTINPSTIVMTPSDTDRKSRYTVQVPRGTLDPGQHRIDIVALTFQGAGSGTVSTAAGVSSQVIIEVPYDGAFIETRLDYTRANRKVVFPLFNKGNALTTVDITLTILGPTNEALHSIRRSEIRVDAQGFTEETIELPDLNPGSYLLRARVEHDNRIIPLERVIEVGVPRLTIFDLGFTLSDTIVKITVPVQSEWNQKIAESYAIHDISTTGGTFIERIKTPTTPIEPFGTAEFTAFWESPGEGDYTLSTIIYYDGETQTAEQSITVTPTGVSLVRQTGQVTAGGNSAWLIFGVLMLVIINIVLITLVVRRKR
jgi:hypothetical protein